MAQRPITVDWYAPRTIVDLVHEELHDQCLRLIDVKSGAISAAEPVPKLVRCCALSKIGDVISSRVISVICIECEVRVYEVDLLETKLLWKANPFSTVIGLSRPTTSSQNKKSEEELNILVRCAISPGPLVRLAVGSNRGHIAIFDAMTGSLLNELRQVSSPVTHLSFCPTSALPDSLILPLPPLPSSSKDEKETNEQPKFWESMLLCSYAEGTCRLFAFPGAKLLSEFYATIPDDGVDNNGISPEVISLLSEDIRELLVSSSQSRTRLPLRTAAWSHDVNVIALAPEADSIEVHKTQALIKVKPEDLVNRKKFRPRKRLDLPCWASDLCFSPSASSPATTPTTPILPPLLLVLDIAGGLHGFDTRSWDLALNLVPMSGINNDSVFVKSNEDSTSTSGGGEVETVDNSKKELEGSGCGLVWLSSTRIAVALHQENSMKVIDIVTKTTFKDTYDSSCLCYENILNEEKLGQSNEDESVSGVLIDLEDIIDQLCVSPPEGISSLTLLPPLRTKIQKPLPIKAVVAGLHSIGGLGISCIASLAANTAYEIAPDCAVVMVASSDHRVALWNLHASRTTDNSKYIESSCLKQAKDDVKGVVANVGTNGRDSSAQEVSDVIAGEQAADAASKTLQVSHCCRSAGVTSYPLGRHERWTRNNVNNWHKAHVIRQVVNSSTSVNKEQSRLLSEEKEGKRIIRRRHRKTSFDLVTLDVMAVFGEGGNEINVWSMPRLNGLSSLSRACQRGDMEPSTSILKTGGSFQGSEWICSYEKHSGSITALGVAPQNLAKNMYCSGDVNGWVHVWVLSKRNQVFNEDGASEDDVFETKDKTHSSRSGVEAVLVAKWKHHYAPIVSVAFTRAKKRIPEYQSHNHVSDVHSNSLSRKNESKFKKKKQLPPPPTPSKQKKQKKPVIKTVPSSCNYGLIVDILNETNLFNVRHQDEFEAEEDQNLDMNEEEDIEMFQVVSCDCSGNVITVQVPTLNSQIFNKFQINESTGGWKGAPCTASSHSKLVTVCGLAKAVVCWPIEDPAITVLFPLPAEQNGAVTSLSMHSHEKQENDILGTPQKDQDEKTKLLDTTSSNTSNIDDFDIAWCSSLGGVWLWNKINGIVSVIPEQGNTTVKGAIKDETINSYQVWRDQSDGKVPLCRGVELFKNWLVTWGGSSVYLFQRPFNAISSTITTKTISKGQIPQLHRIFNVHASGMIINVHINSGKLYIYTEGGWSVAFEIFL